MSALNDAINILGLFSANRPAINQADIVRLLKRPKATVHRALRALTESGFLEYDAQTRLYAPGLRVFQIAQAFRARSSFWDVLHKKVQQICSLCGHTGYITVFDGPDLMVIKMVRGSSPLAIGSAPGYRVSAHATSNGRAMLALLSDEEWARRMPDPLPFVSPNSPATHAELRGIIGRIRATNRSSSSNESYEGIASQGTALRDPESDEIYGVAISYPIHSTTDEVVSTITAHLDQLRAEMAHYTDFDENFTQLPRQT